jgi:tripartite-type tricarboxylate transporter receptor subunit TctC
MGNNVPRFLFAAIVVAAVIGATPASTQDNFPTKPIKIVLPVPAGSALDIGTRAIGEQLASRWGQQVLIEARPGAGGLIAGQAVANAPPDSANLNFPTCRRLPKPYLGLARSAS